jgi:MHS family proline/betaine transporter-like MFS transporter
MPKYFNKFYLPAMLGASIEYYDIALYGYMAPVLVNVFLPNIPKTTAYFLYFFFEFIATLFQVMGARYYGKMGDLHGRKNAMYYAMLGTSCATFVISILPTYHSAGIIAIFLFAAARSMQSFFLGGEYNGGAIYCLEHEKDSKKYGLISGLYCALTVSGIIAASIVATIVNSLGSEYFRLAYGMSFLLALGTYRIRRRIVETPEYLNSKTIPKSPSESLFSASTLTFGFISILIASLFFGMLKIPTRLFNALLPLAIGIDGTQIMILNSVFLVLYMILLVVFGVLGGKYGAQKVMRFGTIGIIVLTYPLMMLIETKSFIAIVIAKAVFAILTAAFIGPFHAWAQSLFHTRTRYKNISTAYAAGKCCSTLLLARSFLIFEHYQSLSSIGIILILCAFLTLRIFKTAPKENFELVAHSTAESTA